MMRTPPKRFKSILLLFLFIGSGVALYMVNPAFFPRILHTAALPLWSIKNKASVESVDFFGLLQSKKMLIDENRELRARISDMEYSTLAIAVLQEENRELKALLGRKDRRKTLLARVLIRPSVSLYDTFVIDVGEDNGVVAGALVAVSDPVIIGQIVKVFPDTSLVKLFSSPGEETNIIIGDEHITATAIGRGGGNFEAHVPRGILVSEGMLITMPSITQNIFGAVEDVLHDPADSFQTILFKNPANMAEVSNVLVLDESIPEKDFD